MPRNNNWLSKSTCFSFDAVWKEKYIPWFRQDCRCDHCRYFRNLQSSSYSSIASYVMTTNRWTEEYVNQLTKAALIEAYYLDYIGLSVGGDRKMSDPPSNGRECCLCDDEQPHLPRRVTTDNDGNESWACDNCYRRGNIFVCRYCRKIGVEGDGTMHDPVDRNNISNTVCHDCDGLETDVSLCDGCECGVDTQFDDSVYTEDDLFYCRYCSEEYTFYCAACDCLYGTNDSYRTGEGSICYNCADEADYCDNCGYYSTDSLACRCVNTVINRYTYRPPYHFHVDSDRESVVAKSNNPRSRPVYYGVELECNYEGTRLRPDVKDFLDTFNAQIKEADPSSVSSGFMYAKSDATVNGAEFVTHPFTYRWLVKHKKIWEANINRLDALGFKADDEPQAGMHVHISRNAFSTLGLYKMMRFLYGNPFIAEKIAGRNNRQMQSYGNIYAETSQSIKDRARSKTNSNRSAAVNLGNAQTYEIRMFQGAHTFEKFMHNMEFCESIVRFCRDMGMSNANHADYTKWLDKHSTEFSRILKTVSSVK